MPVQSLTNITAVVADANIFGEKHSSRLLTTYEQLHRGE